MNIKLIKKNKQEVYRLYFNLLQFALPKTRQLSELEIELLILFLLLPEKYKYQRFSTLTKNKIIKIALDELGWKLSRININNKLYSMIDKGVLRRDEDGVIYLNKAVEQGLGQLNSLLDKGENMKITFEMGASG